VRIFSPASTGRQRFRLPSVSATPSIPGARQVQVGFRPPPRLGLGVALVLAGQRRGGQVRLPWLGALEKNIKRRALRHGAVRHRWHECSTLAVPRDLLPAVRFDCPPEVVVLTPPADEQREGPAHERLISEGPTATTSRRSSGVLEGALGAIGATLGGPAAPF